MLNPYWSVYKNLEKEVLELSNQVHFDDSQLSIYSVKISELLLRCSIEIESISKDLFLHLGGLIPQNGDLYFDTDCLQLLEEKWLLSKKKIMVSAPNFYFTDEENKVLTPLNKANKRGTSGSYWKKAYQAVKHNRVLNLKSGNIKNLIGALGALYILNIYFKDEVYDLEKDSQATNFPTNLGSELFAIKLHKWTSYDENQIYGKSDDFDECVYLTKWKLDSENKIKEANEKHKELTTIYFTNHPKYLTWISANRIEDYSGDNLAWDILGQEEYITMFRETSKELMEANKLIEYEAVANKNSI